VIGPALANNALEITIVGDITVDQAIKSVAATVGALPVRPGAKPEPPTKGSSRAGPGPAKVRVPTEEDLELAKTDALLQLRIGR